VILLADVPWYVHGLNAIVLLVGIFMILLVLIQRGKGGGLAGAFGGTGGSSPFGSRAGDAFTRFTLIIAFVWVLAITIEVLLVQKVGAQQSLLSK
jgi:preprotein translocase subunit SecG